MNPIIENRFERRDLNSGLLCKRELPLHVSCGVKEGVFSPDEINRFLYESFLIFLRKTRPYLNTFLSKLFFYCFSSTAFLLLLFFYCFSSTAFLLLLLNGFLLPCFQNSI
ncbi:MAG: hypothetical protein PHW56_05045, partial [Methanosarcinaceae archaeon]|nr:hypothetical protein [Methanosarcinaceae archaeon]